MTPVLMLLIPSYVEYNVDGKALGFCIPRRITFFQFSAIDREWDLKHGSRFGFIE